LVSGKDLFTGSDLYLSGMTGKEKFNAAINHAVKYLRPVMTARKLNDDEKDKVVEFFSQILGVKFYPFDILKAMQSEKYEKQEIESYRKKKFKKEYQKALKKLTK